MSPQAPRSRPGRAELLRALAGDGERGLEAAAAVLGYERHSAPTERELPSKDDFVPRSTGRRALVPTPPPTEYRRIPFWRPVSTDHAESLAELETVEDPVVPESRPVLTEDDLRPPRDARTPDPPPLAPWPQLWRVLDDTLRTPRPRREMDVNALVHRLARGEQVRELPRRAGLTHARVALVVDRSPRLIPFWDDQVNLVGELVRRFGVANLRLLPPPSDGTLPPPIDTLSVADDEIVLALSDLGFYADENARASWLRFGRDLRVFGARLLALVPCPARRWNGALARQWSALDWGAPAGAARRGALPDPEDLRSVCEQLLRLLSPAMRIEKGLLREVRRLLPSADAGTEADAWNHPRVHGTSSVALCLDEKAAREWQRELAVLPADLRQAAAEAICRWHRSP